MIAEKLQNSVNHLRELLQRDNGDLTHHAPTVLDSLDAEIDRVRGLENVAEIRADILEVYAEGAGARFGCPPEAINGRV